MGFHSWLPNELFDYGGRVIILSRAKRFNRSVDREDFVQTCCEIALEKIRNGLKPAAISICLQAKKKLLKLQYNLTESRSGDGPPDDETMISSLDKTKLEELWNASLPANPKDRACFKKHKLKLRGTRHVVRLSDTEIQEFTGYTQSSLGRMRRLGRPLRAYVHENIIYPSLKSIQEKYAINESAARWRSRPVYFDWDEAGDFGGEGWK